MQKVHDFGSCFKENSYIFSRHFASLQYFRKIVVRQLYLDLADYLNFSDFILGLGHAS